LYNRDVYFHLYEESDSTLAQKEVADVVNLLSLQPSVRILDLCCGYGRHSIELAKRGFEVVGVDISQKQIQHAKEKAKDHRVNVTFQVKDARKLSFTNDFDIILNMFLSFGYFEDEKEDKNMLQGVYQSLKPNGRFLMDFWNREKEIRNFDLPTSNTKKIFLFARSGNLTHEKEGSIGKILSPSLTEGKNPGITQSGRILSLN